jgi:hypothetical protein
MAEADIPVSESLKTSALFNESNPLIADQTGNPPQIIIIIIPVHGGMVLLSDLEIHPPVTPVRCGLRAS